MAQCTPSNKSKPAGTSTVNVASADAIPSVTPDAIVINGIMYSAMTSQASTACVALAPTSSIEQIGSDHFDTGYSYHTYLALSGPVSASVDWTTYSCSPAESDTISPTVPTQSAHAFVAHALKRPFILDSSASNHISPECSDFKNLHAILPHPIEGFNGSSTNAVGIGDIDLCIASGHKLSLRDVLYVPSCSTQLVSVLALARDGYNFVTFGPDGC